jgi:succinate dehydrogenase / fumarate reductase cytochrome b subunit
MAWFSNYANSSIGKKQLMAVTGACLAGFLLVHFTGNATLLIPDEALRQEAFLKVAATYKSLKGLLYLMEAGLVLLFLTHIYNATKAWLGNRAARKQGYDVQTKVGERGLPSFTMVISGAYLAAFLVIHIWSFKYGTSCPVASEGAQRLTGSPDNLYGIVTYWYSQWYYAAFYAIGMLLVGFHLWHGGRSFFQTLGLNHPKYNPAITAITRAFALLIGGGNALIVVVAFLRRAV